MNASELAHIMLEYEMAQQRADALKENIVAAVMDLQSSQKVGLVTATYRKPRKSYNYEMAADGHPMVSEATVSLFTTQADPRTDWRKICKHAGIDEIPFTEGEASVSVKVG